MESRERVIAVINHQKPDRVPYYAWLRANLEEPIAEEYGSLAAFEDKYEFDFSHLFGGPRMYDGSEVWELKEAHGGTVTPDLALDLAVQDANGQDAYQQIRDQVDHHKIRRGRFVYVQTPGIFEATNQLFGIENHLAYLLMYPDELHELYRRRAEWNRQYAMNCIDLGVDMIHVSDDWGAQRSLMFNPRTWWDMIYPYHKVTADAVKERGTFLSLHSDGNVNQVVDGIIKLGCDVVHPWQESAGMSQQDFKDNYIDQFSIMGGLDVQTMIGFGKIDFLKSEIDRVIGTFKDGGLLYCTSHFIQDHCTMDELKIAFDTIYETVRKYAND
ncbi:MAG: uroporphyrinogen decarboxylase family protein [Candidatus Sumerlaeota bacterium]